MVDDIIFASVCGNQVVAINTAITKCARIHVGKNNCYKFPEIIVNGNYIIGTQKEKYISKSASASDTMRDRRSKDYGILWDIRAN